MKRINKRWQTLCLFFQKIDFLLQQLPFSIGYLRHPVLYRKSHAPFFFLTCTHRYNMARSEEKTNSFPIRIVVSLVCHVRMWNKLDEEQYFGSCMSDTVWTTVIIKMAPKKSDEGRTCFKSCATLDEGLAYSRIIIYSTFCPPLNVLLDRDRARARTISKNWASTILQTFFKHGNVSKPSQCKAALFF